MKTESRGIMEKLESLNWGVPEKGLDGLLDEGYVFEVAIPTKIFWHTIDQMTASGHTFGMFTTYRRAPDENMVFAFKDESGAVLFQLLL